MKKHIINHSRYGIQRFCFIGKVSEFYKIYLGAAGIALAFIALFALVMRIAPLLSFLVPVVGYAFVIAHVTASQMNYVVDSTKLNDKSFNSSMRPVKYMLITVTNYLAIVFTVGLMAPWASVRAARYRIENMEAFSVDGFSSFAADSVESVGAVGEEFSDFFDFEMGL